MQDVLEVLETANDNKEVRTEMADEDPYSSSTSDSSSSDDDALDVIRNKESSLITTRDADHEDDGSRGPLNQDDEYEDHRDQLHRRHRGLMQWKVGTVSIILPFRSIFSCDKGA